MRISFRESYCAPFNCLRSLFCCYLPSLERTKDAPNLAPIPNSNQNQNSCTNPIPNSDSASVDDESGEGKAGVLSVEEVRKSCLKKSNGEKKGNVKWKDSLGKELLDIKEYEPRYALSLFNFVPSIKIHNQ